MPSERFDIVIIGSGAGGGTIAHALSASGARILVLERGEAVPREAENWSPAAVWKQQRYQTSERWLDHAVVSSSPYTHYCVGGNTKFWGSVLFRLRREDFQAIAASRRRIAGVADSVRNARTVLRESRAALPRSR